MNTWAPKSTDRKPEWWVVDATDMKLGRLATQIAGLLRGKHKPTFAPHVDMGDYVVVINPEKVLVTGQKSQQKSYFHHTGYFGGIKETSYSELLQKNPEQVIKKAVLGMLPKNKLAKSVFSKLKVYKGSEHPHEAQNPKVLEITIPRRAS